MIDENNKNETIEKYLLGELHGDLLETFKEKLAADENFKKEVDVERTIIRSLKTAGRNEWALKLKNFHQEMEFAEQESTDYQTGIASEEEGKSLETATVAIGDRIPKPLEQTTEKDKPVSKTKIIDFSKRRSAWMVAASVTLLAVCMLTFTLVYNQKTSSGAIFEAYYEPYPEPSIFRGSTDLTALENEAFTAYKQQNFSRSIELFNSILEKQNNETALFYLGNAYVESQKYEEAIQTFERYIKEYEELKVDAIWYLSLSYLKAGKNEEASRYLKQIAATTDTDPVTKDYKNKANEILSKLE